MTVQKVLKTLFEIEIAKFETTKLLFKFSKLLVHISFPLLPVKIPYTQEKRRGHVGASIHSHSAQLCKRPQEFA